MQHIELLNAQNVTIQYETASLWQRMGAYLVDLFIMGVSLLVLIVILITVMQGMISQESSAAIASSIVGFYSLINEYFFNGTSPGKRAFSLKIVSLDGESIFFSQLFARWACRFIDIWLSMGTIGMVFISGNQSGQRLGDVLAGTAVVKTRNSMRFKLRSLQNLPNRDNYTGLYPNVVNLREEEVLLIKKLLERYIRSGKNNCYSEMIFTAVNKVCARLQMPKPEMDGHLFLKEIIKEYIILTR